MSVLNEIDPRTWLWRAAGAVAAVALVWFGVISPYNNYVSAKAVAAALKVERAKTEPVFKELTANFKTLRGTFDNITAASNAESARRKAQIDVKTKELTYALTQNKNLKTDLAALRGANNDFERLLGTIAANNNSAAGSSVSTRLKQLSTAHQQCERALREADDDNAETIGRLDEALAVVRAMKN